MQEFKIYSPGGELLFNDFVDDSSYRLREIMGANDLELRFSLDRFVAIGEGAYCDYKTERYWMPLSQNYVKEHSEHFNYTLKLEGSICLLKSTKFKFFDYVFENGFVKPTSSFKIKFPITATPRMISDLIIANLKLKYPQYDWKVGDCIESDPVTIDFNHDFCFDVLAKVAKDFNTEWELDKFTLNFGRVEKMQGSAVDLSYGYGNGLLGGIQRLQLDSKRIINRVYVDGGDRNIDRSSYGNDTLLLSKNKRITHKGIEYTTDPSGSYLERMTPLAGEEDSLDITKFYPKRVGTVTAVEEIDDNQGFYNIIDADIPADLDYSKHIIEKETMTVIFQTGQLAGKEFDVKYFHKDRRFEIVPIPDNGLIYPKGNLIPAVGDKYAVFHMNMPQKYYDIAENEALQETVKYLWENEQSQYTYRFTLDGNYAKQKWGEIRGFLNCGFFIKFSDPQFLPDAVDVRIVAVKEYINDDKRPEITIANNISSQTFGSVINEIPTQEQATDRKDRDVVNFAKRGFRQALETMQMLVDSGLEGFDDKIQPIAIQSMMGLFGSVQLQFFFVDSKAQANRVASGISYDKENKQLVCPAGLIQHRSIGLRNENVLTYHAPSEYTYWQTKAYETDRESLQADKSYYIYLKCSKTDFTDGNYLVSEKSIAVDYLTNYYHFLVGTLNSEDSEGNRSIVELFGLTEILPSRVNTDRVVSNDGNNFIDFVSNIMRMGDSNASLDWNYTDRGTLTLKGMLNCLKALIGGSYFDNEKIYSQTTIGGKPTFLINGKTGEASFVSEMVQFLTHKAKIGQFDLIDGKLIGFKDGVERVQLTTDAIGSRRSLVSREQVFFGDLEGNIALDYTQESLSIIDYSKDFYFNVGDSISLDLLFFLYDSPSSGMKRPNESSEIRLIKDGVVVFRLVDREIGSSKRYTVTQAGTYTVKWDGYVYGNYSDERDYYRGTYLGEYSVVKYTSARKSVFGSDGFASVWAENKYFFLSADTNSNFLEIQGTMKLTTEDGTQSIIIAKDGIYIEGLGISSKGKGHLHRDSNGNLKIGM